MTAVALAFATAACGPTTTAPATPGSSSTVAAKPPAGMLTAPGIREPFSQADVDFMQGMIPHHAQAVIMAVVGQTDEIKLMQQWLGDRGQTVPDAKSTKMKMNMGGMEMDMLMPGMLSDAEMAELDKARGADFDRLFLKGMIKHHQGAIDMVDVLFKSYGGGQDTKMYKFASDVFADQSIEIDKMKEMLGGGEPLS